MDPHDVAKKIDAELVEAERQRRDAARKVRRLRRIRRKATGALRGEGDRGS